MKKILLLFAVPFLMVSCSKENGGGENVQHEMKISLENLELLVGESKVLGYSVEPEMKTEVVWCSSDENIVTVENGKITAVAAGEAEVAVSSEDGSMSDTCTVKVVKVKFEWLDIPEGTFLMGSSDGSNVDDQDGTGLNLPPSDPDREYYEWQHRVEMSAFRMSAFEVTNRQFCVFLNDNGIGKNAVWQGASKYTDKVLVMDSRNYADTDGYNHNYGLNWDRESNRWTVVSGCDDYPALFVSWYGAYEFAVWAGVSLPTEAQWEYACRAGTSTVHFCGNTDDCVMDYAWHVFNTNGHPEDVGTKLPNPWGLYDMIGNAYEWCADWMDYKYGMESFNETVKDPSGPDGPVSNTGNAKVLRGGSWNAFAVYSRAAFRMFLEPHMCNNYAGFRVVSAK